jgi:exopolysaccharide production protein ExoY
MSDGMPENILSSKPLGISREGSQPVGGIVKRLIDIFIATTALLLLLPVFAITALLVGISGRGPVIFGHMRVGYAGVPFMCFKFRTMVVDANAVLKAYLDQNPDAAREWQETRKLKYDPRVTPIGSFLRKLSLDELPQLWNVLKGDMSCVGPRPVTAEEFTRYGAHAITYLSARPGVTGLWQTTGRNTLHYDERVALDVAYVLNWSIWLDLKIILRTIPAVMRTDQTS